MISSRERAIRAVNGEAERLEREGWHVGPCWFGCRNPATLVQWVANARTRYGDVEVTACAPCQREFDELAWQILAERDIADMAAR